jgi:DNA modification methylase
MAVLDQEINDKYAIYNGDCCEVLPTLPSESVHFSAYSPPFASLYEYSSSDHDIGNCKSYEQFLTHYGFVVEQVARVTLPGRLTAVHCTDIARGGSGGFVDLPGDIIRLHEKHGFIFHARYSIWKEPLRVAIRTRALGLMHKQIVKDSSLCGVAAADYLIVMRKRGENPIPITHAEGLSRYAGEREVPAHLLAKFKNWPDPKTNKLSHWIWQQYASSVWMDIRVSNVLKYRSARESDEEKHVCPLQLDVIDRCMAIWSNPGETVLTPFMGVGSEVFGAVRAGRRAIGIELKPSYFRQAKANVPDALVPEAQQSLFDLNTEDIAEEDTEAL